MISFFQKLVLQLCLLRAILEYTSLKSSAFTSAWIMCLEIFFLSRPGLDLPPLFPQGQVQPGAPVAECAATQECQKCATCYHTSQKCATK